MGYTFAGRVNRMFRRLAWRGSPAGILIGFMDEQIIGLQDWLTTPVGSYLLGWEQKQLDAIVADAFGFHALQLGIPVLDALRSNRMPYRWLADQQADTSAPLRCALVTDFAALPFAAASLDLLVLPHALECSADPHATLREVERVLVPDGRVVICGFNPTSLWTVRQGLGHLLRRIGLRGRMGPLYLPASGESIGLWRLRDWLRLLSFDTAQVRYGCYVPPVRSVKWLTRWGFVERMGARWWPILGAAYVVVGVKRVRGMRLMATAWKPKPQRAAQTAPVASHLEAGKQSIPHE